MKPILIWAFMLVSMVALGQNCKWGLSPPNNQATCGVVEQAAASRMIRAKTVLAQPEMEKRRSPLV